MAFGITLGLLGAYGTKRKKKMRIFDNFTEDVKIDILETCVAYAKGEIEEIGNPMNYSIEIMAASYGGMFFIEVPDFGLIEIQTVVAWTGPRPTHLPR